MFYENQGNAKTEIIKCIAAMKKYLDAAGIKYTQTLQSGKPLGIKFVRESRLIKGNAQ